MKWKSKNRKRSNELNKKYYNLPSVKESRLRYGRSEKRAKLHREWVKVNPDKVKKYQVERNQNKEHDISNEQWIACKEYFNYQCAYCGINETDAKEQQGQRLHKEHVVNNGANDLSNCVPACRSCNSQKWKYELQDWYNEDNEKYSIMRLNKINKWLKEDFKKIYFKK